MRVALDADGVICGWLDGVLDTVCEVTGRRYQRQEITSWDPWVQCETTLAERDAVFEAMNAPGWHEALEVLPGAQEAVKALQHVADVYIVTAPWWSCPTWEYERKRWLYRHFGIGADRVVATAAKYVVSADFFVDDAAPNIRSWLDHNSGVGLLLDAPYNRGVDLPRVRSLPEFVDIVKSGVVAA